MSFVPRILACLALALAAPLVPAAQQDPHAGHDHADGAAHGDLDEFKRQEPWTAETLELARRIPVQDGGRVKPLSSYAGFTMLRLNGKRSLETPDGEELDPTAWLLDVLYFPIGAAEYEMFLVENDEVISAMGLDLEGKKKRDRYSYMELEPGLERLMELAREYHGIEEKKRSSVQNQIVVLSSNVNTFHGIAGHMTFAEVPIPLEPEVQELFDRRAEVRYHDVLPKLPELRRMSEGDDEAESRAAFRVLSTAAQLAQGSRSLAFLAPDASREDEPEWRTPGELFDLAYGGGDVSEHHVEVLATVAETARHRNDPKAFESAIGNLVGQTRELAAARGEYGKVPLEVTYYGWGLLKKSLVFFLLAFVTGALLWFRPRNKFLYGVTAGAAFSATLLLIVAIVIRCIIRERPPVSTLYETLLFVAATGATTALIVEWINRKRIALTTGVVMATVGLFLANKYEMVDKQDTMPSLVAVLDTNFWLSTHVTSITLGYSAGMLAAFMGSFYILAKFLGFRRGDRAFYSGLSRMVYGVICFAVIFSTVGTILGGVWANDSWGRFWGWDPKENGALLIVISQLAILHGRMGGYLREHGICMAAAFGGTVIAFSWFGVNLLGVGLHSYGFTSGIAKALWTYYYVQWGIVALGALTWWMHRQLRVATR